MGAIPSPTDTGCCGDVVLHEVFAEMCATWLGANYGGALVFLVKVKVECR